MSTPVHRLIAEIEVPVGTNIEDIDYIPCKLEITYSYIPGAPDYYNRSVGGPGGWDQGYASEVSLVAARVIQCEASLWDSTIRDMAEDYLQNEGYEEACTIAEEAGRPDPDESL